jgi:hypothetical protein
MANMEKNIDKLFVSGLGRDNPPFREEYWNQLEGLLDAVPPTASNGSGGSNMPDKPSLISAPESVSVFMNKMIITVVSGIIISVSTLFFIIQSNKDSIPAEITTPQSAQNHPITEIELKTPSLNSLSHFDHAQTSTGYSNQSPLTVAQSCEEILRNGSGEHLNTPPFNQTERNIASSEDRSERADLLAPRVQRLVNQHNDAVHDPESGAKLSDDHQEINRNITQYEASGLEYTTDTTAHARDLLVQSKDYQTLKRKEATALSLIIEPGMLCYQQIENRGLSKGSAVTPSLGLSVHYALNERLALSMGGALFATNGHQLLYASTQSFLLNYQQKETITIENRELLFAELPLTIHLKMGQHHLGIGPRVLFLLDVDGNKTVEVTTPFGATSESEPVKGYFDGLSRIIAGAGIEYGYAITPGVVVALRYNHTIGSLVKEDVYQNVNRNHMNTINLSLKVSTNNILRK